MFGVSCFGLLEARFKEIRTITLDALSHRKLYSSHKQTTGVGRMKLVEILAGELEEWPDHATMAVQDADGQIKMAHGEKPKISSSSRIWVRDGEVYHEIQHRGRELSEDHAAAIVTRADWEAERAKLKAPKANADGWVRHRGGKCPVDAGVLVDVRNRAGDIALTGGASCTSVSWHWSHDKHPGDIMAYKIHKPAEQLDPSAHKHQQPAEQQSTGQDLHGMLRKMDGPDVIQWRNRIREIDTERAEVESVYQLQISEITQERELLVQKFAGEGLALVEVVVQPDKSLDDWRNWKAGDVVEVELENYAGLAIGSQHVVRSVEDEEYDGAMPVSVWTVSDYTWPKAQDESGRCVFKFVSRPAT